MGTLKLYVFSNRDGMTVVPVENGLPDSRRRVYLAGDARMGSLNEDQVNALIEVAFRDPDIRGRSRRATFYDGQAYSRGVKRPKILLSHRW